jgi:hypothetical protein
MADKIATYQVLGGWVVAQGHWLPGVFDTEATARYACRFPDDTLEFLRQDVLIAEDRPITRADLFPHRKRRTT